MRSRTTEKFLLAAKQAGIFSLEQVAASCEIATAVSDLVHYLQRERGSSAIYLASKQQLFVDQKNKCTAARMEKEEIFRHLLDEKQSMLISAPGGMRLLNSVALSLEGLDDLQDLVVKIEQQKITASESTQAISRLISSLLSVVFEAADIASDPDVTRTLVALFNLMQGKEYSGLERAWAAMGFAAGSFDKDLNDSIRHLLQAQKTSFDIFEQFVPEQIAKQWQVIEQSEDNQNLMQLRNMIEKLQEGETIASELSEVWYELSSKRIDKMRPLEIELTKELHRVSCARVAEEKDRLVAHKKRLESLSANDITTNSLLTPLLGEEEGRSNELNFDDMPSVGIALEHYRRPELARSVYDLVCGQAQHIQRMSEELEEARTALSERKLIERAKGLLMQTTRMSEESAYRRLQQHAMKENKRLSEVATEVIRLVEEAKKQKK